MMNSPRMILLLLFALFISSHVASESLHREGSHLCPSCASKGFMFKRWLMQDMEINQSMGWLDWRGSDCDAGTTFVVPCFGSCLTVMIEKQTGVNQYLYQGSMQECSDGLIKSSPDLPKEFNFSRFYEDAIYTSKRMNHRITYSFVRKSYLDKDAANTRKLKEQKAATALSKKPDEEDHTVRDYIFFFAIGISGVVLLSVYFGFYGRKTIDRMIDLYMMCLRPRHTVADIEIGELNGGGRRFGRRLLTPRFLRPQRDPQSRAEELEREEEANRAQIARFQAELAEAAQQESSQIENIQTEEAQSEGIYVEKIQAEENQAETEEIQVEVTEAKIMEQADSPAKTTQAKDSQAETAQADTTQSEITQDETIQAETIENQSNEESTTGEVNNNVLPPV